MENLNNICYEQIKDNFWYGLFGDFKLIIDKNTGYFNATKLCQSGGKQFKNWIRLDSSKNLMEFYSDITAGSHLSQLNSSYYIEPKGTNECDLIISGTYLREELILNLAIWLSNDFYDKCYRIIKDYFAQDFNRIKNDKGKLQSRIKQVEKSLENLTLENTKLENKIYQLKPI